MSAEQHHTTLILIQLARRALIQRPAHQPTEIPGAEPDLGFQQDGAQWAVMAVEGGGDQRFGCGLPGRQLGIEVLH